MDAGWFLGEIAKMFWHARHPRLRKARPSVPQVSPPTSASSDAPRADAPDRIVVHAIRTFC